MSTGPEMSPSGHTEDVEVVNSADGRYRMRWPKVHLDGATEDRHWRAFDWFEFRDALFVNEQLLERHMDNTLSRPSSHAVRSVYGYERSVIDWHLAMYLENTTQREEEALIFGAEGIQTMSDLMSYVMGFFAMKPRPWLHNTVDSPDQTVRDIKSRVAEVLSDAMDERLMDEPVCSDVGVMLRKVRSQEQEIAYMVDEIDSIRREASTDDSIIPRRELDERDWCREVIKAIDPTVDVYTARMQDCMIYRFEKLVQKRGLPNNAAHYEAHTNKKKKKKNKKKNKKNNAEGDVPATEEAGEASEEAKQGEAAASPPPTASSGVASSGSTAPPPSQPPAVATAAPPPPVASSSAASSGSTAAPPPQPPAVATAAPPLVLLKESPHQYLDSPPVAPFARPLDTSPVFHFSVPPVPSSAVALAQADDISLVISPVASQIATPVAPLRTSIITNIASPPVPSSLVMTAGLDVIVKLTSGNIYMFDMHGGPVQRAALYYKRVIDHAHYVAPQSMEESVPSLSDVERIVRMHNTPRLVLATLAVMSEPQAADWVRRVEQIWNWEELFCYLVDAMSAAIKNQTYEPFMASKGA